MADAPVPVAAAAPPVPALAAAPPSPPPAADRRAMFVVFALLATALIVLLAGYLVITIPGAWFGAASPKTFDAHKLAIAVGTGAMDEDTLAVTPSDSTGTIIVTAAVSIPAGDYRGVAWRVTGLPPGTEARLLWRSEAKPGRTFTFAIPQEADRLAPIVVSRDTNWIGPLNGIALALRLPTPEQVRISGVTVDPMTLSSQLAGRMGDWTTFEPWSGASINTVVGGADLQELPLSVLLGLAVLIATAAAVALARWRPQWIGSGLPLALVVMFVAAWLLLDLRWQWNLSRQVAVTARTYAGKDWHEKHVAAEDGPLFEFIERVRAKLAPPPARVFMAAEAALLPRPRRLSPLPVQRLVRSVDECLAAVVAVTLGRLSRRLSAPGHPVRCGARPVALGRNPPIAAEALVVEPGAALFRIR